MIDLDEVRGKAIVGLLSIAVTMIFLDGFTNSRFYLLEMSVTAVASIAFVVLHIIYWRCSFCKKMLPLAGSRYKVYPYCGESLKDNHK